MTEHGPPYAYALQDPNQRYLKFRWEHVHARYVHGLKSLLPATNVPANQQAHAKGLTFDPRFVI
jgi:hypothetical protein